MSKKKLTYALIGKLLFVAVILNHIRIQVAEYYLHTSFTECKSVESALLIFPLVSVGVFFHFPASIL